MSGNAPLSRQKIIQELLEEINELIDENSWFDRDFFDSIQTQFSQRADLSDRQIQALQNIREKLER